MKKTTILAAAAAFAALLTGCAKQEPTELKQENMPNKSMVYGFVESTIRGSSGTFTDKEIEPKATVYITIDGKETLVVTTDKDGFFQQEIGLGNKAVEVKAEVWLKDRESYLQKKGSSTWTKTTVDLYGTKTATLAPHNSASLNITAAPVTAYGDPDLEIEAL